jgi:Amino acid transporters
MALKFGKWVATVGAAIRILLIAFFTLTVLIYAGEHGLHGFGAGAFKPTWLVFLAAAPILIFNLEGFELPSAASEEMVNPRRDVPFAVCAPESAPCCSTASPSWRSCWCSRRPGCPTWGDSSTRCSRSSSSTGAT